MPAIRPGGDQTAEQGSAGPVSQTGKVRVPFLHSDY